MRGRRNTLPLVALTLVTCKTGHQTRSMCSAMKNCSHEQSNPLLRASDVDTPSPVVSCSDWMVPSHFCRYWITLHLSSHRQLRIISLVSFTVDRGSTFKTPSWPRRARDPAKGPDPKRMFYDMGHDSAAFAAVQPYQLTDHAV
jgi:hypothetical protein